MSKSLSSREDSHKLVQNLINKLKLWDQFTTENDENDVTIFDIIISGSDQAKQSCDKDKDQDTDQAPDLELESGKDDKAQPKTIPRLSENSYASKKKYWLKSN